MTHSQVAACPRCDSLDFHSSRPRGLDRLWRFLGAQPYRCYECGQRFHSRAPRMLLDSSPLPPAIDIRGECPNCTRTLTVALTPAEKRVADADGWVVSCPGCGALYALRSRRDDAAARS